MISEASQAGQVNFANIYSLANSRCWNVVVRIHNHLDEFRRGRNYLTIKGNHGDDGKLVMNSLYWI